MNILEQKTSDFYPLSSQTRVLRGLITHPDANTEIEQTVNVHEIQHAVHEMFTIYPRKPISIRLTKS